MKFITFKNGDMMPLLGLGTWKSKKGKVGPAIREAIRAGYRHVDCAPIYGNEAEIGQAFTAAFRVGDARRKRFWVTSKLWNTAHRAAEVRPALEKTLRDLKLDYLDLFLIHWPVVQKVNNLFPNRVDTFVPLDEVPTAETWGGMEACLEAGLCRHIGVSNFSVKKLGELLAVAKHAPEMCQVESHPYFQQAELFAFCKSNGIHFTAYSPLGSNAREAGILPDGQPDLFADAAIVEIAAQQGCTPAQVLISWAMKRGTAVIPKSTNSGRLSENFGAVKVKLTDEDMARIATLDRHHRFVDGTFWTAEGSPYTLENLWDEGEQ